MCCEIGNKSFVAVLVDDAFDFAGDQFLLMGI
jgi:hypothetical protein